MADDTGCNQPWSLLPEQHHKAYHAISPFGALRGAATGKRVLVTGAGRGIGKAIATAYLQAGAAGVALLSRNQQQLDSVAKELLQQVRDLRLPIEKAKGASTSLPAILPIAADVSDPAQVERAVKSATESLGGLDIVVANAGAIEKPSDIANSSPDEWWSIYETNVRGTYNVFRSFLGYVKDLAAPQIANENRRKVVIAVSDSAGYFAPPGLSAHATSKTAVNRIVEYVHLENETESPQVKAFAFTPGAVRTDLALQLGEEYHEYLTDNDDMAGGFAVWLGCEESTDFLSGRFLSAQWDVEQLLAAKSAIAKDGLLKTRVLMK